MNKTLLIIQREYITRVRKKSFIIFTLLGPVFFLLISLLPILIANANKNNLHILVKDDSGLIPALPDTAGLYFTYKYQSIPVNTLKTDYSTIGEGYDAFLYIPAMQPDAPYGIEIYSNEQVSLTTKLYIESIIADKLETIKYIGTKHIDSSGRRTSQVAEGTSVAEVVGIDNVEPIQTPIGKMGGKTVI